MKELLIVGGEMFWIGRGGGSCRGHLLGDVSRGNETSETINR